MSRNTGFFTSYNFVPFLREYARGELTLKHRLLLGVLDQGSQTLRFINFGMYYVLFKDTDGRISPPAITKHPSEQPTPFRVQVYPLNDIQSVFFANNSRLLSMAEANMALLTTKNSFCMCTVHWRMYSRLQRPAPFSSSITCQPAPSRSSPARLSRSRIWMPFPTLKYDSKPLWRLQASTRSWRTMPCSSSMKCC